MAGISERVRAARALLDRPLTSYYLILGITTLLLCLGLMMVLSTASVIDLTRASRPTTTSSGSWPASWSACRSCG